MEDQYCPYCHQCSNFENSFVQLQNKECSLRVKVDDLTRKVSELSKQKKLLEKQNKLLINTCSLPIANSNQEEISSKDVENLLKNFDDVFNSQGNDMIRLLNERNSLANLVFKSLKIIDAQNDKIQKYDKLVHSLLQYTQPQHLQGRISTQLSQLGIQYTQYLYPRDIEQSNSNEFVDKQSENYLISLLTKINTMYPQTHPYIFEISQQISKKNKEYQEITNKNIELTNKYNNILTILGISESKDITSSVTKIVAESKLSKKLYNFGREIVSVFINFAEQFCMDNHVELCLSRLRKWLNYNDKTIDVIQEIDFLLGLCFPLSDSSSKRSKSKYKDPFEY
ncbi:hypothetical protein TVAG_125350 [Trichomonas vaginalis G3]|uniref:Uncharacterized protein n=1 Tax=Trichomonas vaginalis (strain ATCC PRA-98 / G3) TaxID=412133 RepID=A2F9L0_TRIV3|nr:hypothetical protein TVAGG3_0941540 [Trichomonas vaginalis G3]EAX98391.1 hypothetical protein TVAG_125350 [Trichomonas vaginalis G3]KAI5486576.1 hypothetical protein TVAGG3_0941540 [Trichomonas vaginalis G3]|eukprot:XP_001311321.1 hypothetical protein [Trichomonas vaginalis G3]